MGQGISTRCFELFWNIGELAGCVSTLHDYVVDDPSEFPRDQVATISAAYKSWENIVKFKHIREFDSIMADLYELSPGAWTCRLRHTAKNALKMCMDCRAHKTIGRVKSNGEVSERPYTLLSKAERQRRMLVLESELREINEELNEALGIVLDGITGRFDSKQRFGSETAIEATPLELALDHVTAPLLNRILKFLWDRDHGTDWNTLADECWDDPPSDGTIHKALKRLESALNEIDDVCPLDLVISKANCRVQLVKLANRSGDK